jgi:hypothetical protein
MPALAAASAALAWLGLAAGAAVASSRRLGPGWRPGLAILAVALFLI